jgi:uncharacterized protein
MEPRENTMFEKRFLAAVALCFCLGGPMAFANEAGKQPGIDPAVLTEGFLAAHPDLRWRGEGMRAYDKGDFESAATYFRRAARHADKPSQAMLGEMHWRGIGVDRDRAMGYVWMDLAGERMYPDFIVMRERYWNDMDEAERAAAVERGQAVFDEYADAVAKPRLEAILRRERRKTTGSRTGFVGNLTIVPNSGPLAGTGMTISGDQFYAKEYWEPAYYWQLQDEIWRAPARGRVDASELQPVRSPPAQVDGDE